MVDELFRIAFASAQTAIFEVGSVMAVLMLVFGILDYRYGDRLRHFIEIKKLDKPIVMAGLTIIPVDGTLLFQYNLYRRGSIRLGSLLAGIIGFGEEATYLILVFNPLAWVLLVVIKLVLALVTGGIVNRSKFANRWKEELCKKTRLVPSTAKPLRPTKIFMNCPTNFDTNFTIFVTMFWARPSDLFCGGFLHSRSLKPVGDFKHCRHE